MRIYFATDLHGSEICWKKLLAAHKFYEADLLIAGGDVSGKAIIPIVGDGSKAQAQLLETRYELESLEAIADFEKKVMGRGYYPVRLSPDEFTEYAQNPAKLDVLYLKLVCETLTRWLNMAADKLPKEVRLIMCPGNDDPVRIDSVIAACDRVENGEAKTLELDAHFKMLSCGFVNTTPWHTYREESDEQLTQRLAGIAPAGLDYSRTIFNLHPPPYNSGLDEVPELNADLSVKNAGAGTVAVGSKAVRNLLESHQPLCSLHGHIHEGKGTMRLKKTLAINPGSLYEQGILQGVVLDLDKKKGLKNYMLTSG